MPDFKVSTVYYQVENGQYDRDDWFRRVISGSKERKYGRGKKPFEPKTGNVDINIEQIR